MALVSLAFVLPAFAVSLSRDGDGQVLIYPYYNLAAGQHDTLRLSNDSDAAKAVKLVVREGVRGDAAFVLNVYLAPRDTWTGVLFAWGDGGDRRPALLSNDSSCTLPDLHAASLPKLPDGRHYLRPNGPAANRADASLGEGYVVAIEMGELHGASAKAVTPRDRLPDATEHVPRSCATVAAQWANGGAWRRDPATEVTAPTGDLSGALKLIDIPAGSLFRVRAVALDGFRVAAMNTAPDALQPNLADALSDVATGDAIATIPLGDAVVVSHYPAARAIDAVTAVLMTNRLRSDFDFRRSTDAHSAFVFTMPTKRFYVDSGNHAVAPFGRDAFHAISPRNTLCPIIGQVAWGADGASDGKGLGAGFPGSAAPELANAKPCYATSIMALDPAKRPRELLHSALRGAVPLRDAPLDFGRVAMFMNAYSPACFGGEGCFEHTQGYVVDHINVMRPDRDGRQYFGLPVVGFVAVGYINRHAAGTGVLGNFTFAEPLSRADAECARNGKLGNCR